MNIRHINAGADILSIIARENMAASKKLQYASSTRVNISAYSRSLAIMAGIASGALGAFDPANVVMGKSIIDNWKLPSDSQIDSIMHSIASEV